MSIFRAFFWLGVVAFLMPHEPDLGLGRPGILYTTHSSQNDGAVDRMFDGVADKLSHLRSQFADQDR